MLHGRAAVREHGEVVSPSYDTVATPTVRPARRPAREYLWRWAPLALVAVVVGWDLWQLRIAVDPVAYLNDGSVHQQMVRDATRLIEAGRLPFTSWLPYIGLGSAQFLHYQSLGSVLTGLAGAVVGANTAYRWALYLLLALWPLAIYSSARLFGLTRGAAAAAALLSPFIVSYTGVGFERGAYVWIGGAEVWTQLLGSWALPFAWACTWRAMKDARFIWVAAALVGLTVGLHFLCGYLAFLGVIVLALAADGQLRKRLARAAMLFGASLAAAAWVIVPLILMSKWSAINQPLAETPYVKGYGVRQELVWLFTGQMFDAKRVLPAITVLVLVGAVLAVARWRRDPLMRSLLALFVACLLLSFGSSTWGGLANVVPAHADLYFRRFTMGSQLAGIYLAGTALAFAWQVWVRIVDVLASSRLIRVTALGCIGGRHSGVAFPRCRAGLELRPAQHIHCPGAASGRQHRWRHDRPPYLLYQTARGRSHLRRATQQLGAQLYGRFRARLQVHRKPGRRRSHLPGPDIVVDAGPGNEFRRGQPF